MARIRQPVRVTYVIGSLAIGGAETQLVRLVNGLDRSRFQPSIICMSEGGDLRPTVAEDVEVLIASPSGRGARSRTLLGARLLGGLVRSIRSRHPDVVHSYLPAAYVLGSLAAWSVRVPLIVAGRRALTGLDIYGNLRWRTLANVANRVIDVHICNSDAVRDVAIRQEGIRPDRTRVVHNGIDVPRIAPVALPSEWQSAGTRAVMVANLIRYKGHREVLEAIARVVQRHPSFMLVLMGDGVERGELVSLARHLGITGNVVFAGLTPDASHVVAGFDFALLGSSEEGFPNALMEAMAAGVPVVSTAVGGVPELVEDGVHGKLVPFGDVEAMASAIEWMIEHPEQRREMGDRARQRIEQEFSTATMVAATEAIYEEFLSRVR